MPAETPLSSQPGQPPRQSLPEAFAEVTGLTAAEVAAAVAAGQVNRAPRDDLAQYADIVRRNVLTIFNFMVTPASAALFALGEWKGGLAVGTLAVVNTVLSVVQEIKAKWDLDQLSLLAETRTRVVRDAAVVEVLSSEVVAGDVVLLSPGDSVVADGPVLVSRFLEVDEALLTGESDPVRKAPGEVLLSGSFAVAGEGAFRAERVGPASFAQATSRQARRVGTGASPLQSAIDDVVALTSYTALALSLLYGAMFVLAPFADNAPDNQRELVKFVAITITGMVPQGLVLTATMAFTIGAVVMSRRGAIVRRLPAVETMAEIDVICTDKTGTLTTNQLRLDRLVTIPGGPDDRTLRQEVALLAAASIDDRNKTLAALRAALADQPARPHALLDSLAFKSQNRYSAVRVIDQGRRRLLAMGAPEALMALMAPACREAAGPALGRGLGDLQRAGLRVVLIAEADDPRPDTPLEGTLEGWSLRPLGLAAFADELRPEAADVLRALTDQGIAFKIISGDNPETVRATVGALNIPASREAVVSGPQLADATPAQRAELVDTHSVFGRVLPQQKVEIVQGLQSRGHRVAMIGDGVNDLLPIKAAHLGIAMGDGAAATKTVSAIVLENNNFALLPETLDEGRTIVRNLRRAAKIFLTKNVYILVLLLTGVVGLTTVGRPFDPQQMTMLNWLTVGIPAFVIALSRERSQTAHRGNFLWEVGGFSVRTGVVFAVVGLGLLTAAAALYPRAVSPAEAADQHLTLQTRRDQLAQALASVDAAYAARLGRPASETETTTLLSQQPVNPASAAWQAEFATALNEQILQAPDYNQALWQTYRQGGGALAGPFWDATRREQLAERFLVTELAPSAATRLGLTLSAGLPLTEAADRIAAAETRQLHRTMLMAALVLLGLTALMRSLTDGETTPLRGDGLYRWMALVSIPVLVAFVYVGFTQRFFNLSPLTVSQWLMVLVAVGLGWGLSWLADRLWVVLGGESLPAKSAPATASELAPSPAGS